MSEKTAGAKQGWVTLALVLAVSFVFGLVVLPRIQPAREELVGTNAPEFALPIIYGGSAGDRVRLSDLRGQVVILDFWASWCGPCRKQAPIVDSLAQKYRGKGVTVLGISTSDEADRAAAFLKELGVSYSSAFDENGAVARAYGVQHLPTLVVIDAEGQVSAVQARVVGARQLESLVEDAAGG